MVLETSLFIIGLVALLLLFSSSLAEADQQSPITQIFDQSPAGVIDPHPPTGLTRPKAQAKVNGPEQTSPRHALAASRHRLKSYRHAIGLLLGLARAGDAVKLANEALQRYPKARRLHFQIASLFQRFRQCVLAKPVFRQMRKRYRSSRHWPALRYIENACGDIWLVTVMADISLSRRKSLIDAPQQIYVAAASGSQIDQFCARYSQLCDGLRQIHHKVDTSSGYQGQFTTSFSLTLPNDHRKFCHIALRIAKTVTSKSTIGSDGFGLRYLFGWHQTELQSKAISLRLGSSSQLRGVEGEDLDLSWAGFDVITLYQLRKWNISYRHGLALERHWSRQANNQLLIITSGVSGRAENSIEWHIDTYLEQRSRLFPRRRLLASVGRAVKVELQWSPLSRWNTIISYQHEKRQFLTAQLYLAAPHETATTRMNMRVERLIGNLTGGIELDRVRIRSQDQFARRHRTNYTVYLRYQF